VAVIVARQFEKGSRLSLGHLSWFPPWETRRGTLFNPEDQPGALSARRNRHKYAKKIGGYWVPYDYSRSLLYALDSVPLRDANHFHRFAFRRRLRILTPPPKMDPLSAVSFKGAIP
jgi:hypothetical protein